MAPDGSRTPSTPVASIENGEVVLRGTHIIRSRRSDLAEAEHLPVSVPRHRVSASLAEDGKLLAIDTSSLPAAMQNTFSVQLFGTVDLLGDDQQVNVGGPRQQAVIAILLLQGQALGIDAPADMVRGRRPSWQRQQHPSGVPHRRRISRTVGPIWATNSCQSH